MASMTETPEIRRMGEMMISLAEMRVLWWMKHMEEYPSAIMRTVDRQRVPDRPRWGGVSISYLSPVGLSAPRVLQATATAMTKKGLAEFEPEHLPDNVIAFPRADWDERMRYHQANTRRRGRSTMVRTSVRLLPCEGILARVPDLPPLPWVPEMNSGSDVVRTEEQRQANIANYLRITEAYQRRKADAVGRE